MYEAKMVLYLEVLLGVGLLFWRWAASREARRYTDGRIEALVLSMPPILFFSPNIWVLFVLSMIAIPMLARSRPEAVGLFILVSVMTPIFGQDIKAGSLYIASVYLTTFATIGLLIARFTVRGRSGAGLPALDLAVAAVVLALFFMYARGGGNPIRPLVQAILGFGLPYFVVSRTISNAADLRQPVTLLILSGVLLTFVSIFETIRHWPLYQEVYAHYGLPTPDISSVLRVRGGLMRAPTTFPESTAFGLFLSVVIVMLANFRPVARSSGMFAVFLALVGFGIVSTVSRGAIVGSALGLTAAAIYRGYGAKAAGYLAVAAVAGVVLLTLTPQTFVLRQMFGLQGGSRLGSSDYRVDLFDMGMIIVRENPVLGLPVQTVVDRLAMLKSGGIVDFVNSYLFFAMTSGVVGMTALILMHVVPITIVARRRRTVARQDAPLVAGLLGTIIMFAFALFFTSFTERNVLWLLITLGMVAAGLRASLLTRKVEKAARAPSRVPAGGGLPFPTVRSRS